MDEFQMYVEYRDDKPVGYRYGEPWVAQQLAMEGGYSSPELAELMWSEYLSRREENDFKNKT